MDQSICNICGANYEYHNGRWKCPACGASKAEEFSNEETTLLYCAAQKLRLSNFSEAEEAYTDIIEKYPMNANGYWGRLLSKYGIKYEADFDGKKIPTCYATSIESILLDADYAKALDLADNETRKYFTTQATYIETIREEWVKKAGKEQPYDIFICYKDSDTENGIERTKDSVVAQELYIHLIEQGYRVFFSRESLRGKVGEKFEPYIFNAISTSKIMIVYGSSAEYITSTWLKNEWHRFYKRMETGEKHPQALIVACDGFSPSKLPSILSSRQCLNATRRTFFVDLDKSIKKVIQEYAVYSAKSTPSKGIPEFKTHKHQYTDTIVPATCLAKGYTIHKCNCGYEYTDTYTSITDHRYSPWTELTHPSCIEDGKVERRCVICGHTENKIQNKVGHDFSGWTTHADGRKTCFCQNCGAVKTIEIVSRNTKAETSQTAETGDMSQKRNESTSNHKHTHDSTAEENTIDHNQSKSEDSTSNNTKTIPNTKGPITKSVSLVLLCLAICGLIYHLGINALIDGLIYLTPFGRESATIDSIKPPLITFSVCSGLLLVYLFFVYCIYASKQTRVYKYLTVIGFFFANWYAGYAISIFLAKANTGTLIDILIAIVVSLVLIFASIMIVTALSMKLEDLLDHQEISEKTRRRKAIFALVRSIVVFAIACVMVYHSLQQNDHWEQTENNPSTATSSNNETASNSAEATIPLQFLTVYFNANGGTGIMDSQNIVIASDEELHKCMFVREGYTFSGWATSEAGNVVYRENALYSAVSATSETLYAVWIPNQYTVIYDANGGTGIMDQSTHTYDLPSMLASNEFTYTGHTFIGWNTIQDGSGIFYLDNSSIANLVSQNNGNITLYAMWETNSYSITFVTDGKQIIDPQYYVYGETTVNLPDPTRDGYEFVGWQFSVDGFALGDIMPACNITAVASWKYKSLTYDSGYEAKKVDSNVYDYDYIDVSTLSPFMMEGYKLEFTVSVYMWEKNEGYQTICLRNTNGVDVASIGDDFAHGGSGKDGEAWNEFVFTIEGEDCTNTMILRYSAKGLFANVWYRGQAKATITVIRE